MTSLFYLACSPEESVKTSEPNATAYRLQNVKVAAAKNLYISMMTTKDYTDYRSSIRAFNLKLKNKVSFTTKTDWMTWIDSNISKTNFTSKVEFETIYNDMSNKLSELMKNNSALYGYLANADADQIAIIMAPGRDVVPTYTGTVLQTCLDNCISVCDAAIDANEVEYNNNIHIAESLPRQMREGIYLGAEISHDQAFLEISAAFNASAGGCPQ